MEPSTHIVFSVSKLSSPPESTSECERMDLIESRESILFNRLAILALSVVGNVTSSGFESARESTIGFSASRRGGIAVLKLGKQKQT